MGCGGTPGTVGWLQVGAGRVWGYSRYRRVVAGRRWWGVGVLQVPSGGCRSALAVRGGTPGTVGWLQAGAGGVWGYSRYRRVAPGRRWWGVGVLQVPSKWSRFSRLPVSRVPACPPARSRSSAAPHPEPELGELRFSSGGRVRRSALHPRRLPRESRLPPQGCSLSTPRSPVLDAAQPRTAASGAARPPIFRRTSPTTSTLTQRLQCDPRAASTLTA